MLVAKLDTRDPNLQLLLVGITAGNVERLKQKKPLVLSRKTHGVAVPENVMFVVVYGEDEKAILAELAKHGMLGEETVDLTGTPLETQPREYPEGRLGATDDGQASMAVTHDPAKDQVVISFEKPVYWLSFPPDQAIEVAKLIVKHAAELWPDMKPICLDEDVAKLVDDHKLTKEEILFALRLAVQRKSRTSQGPWDGKEPF